MGVSCSARTREGAAASDWGGRVSGGLGRGEMETPAPDWRRCDGG